MDKFEKRRDRYELFNSFDNPLINLTFPIEVDDFRPFCKQKNHPPFHFFLYVLFQALMKTENFRYRIHEGEVIKINSIIPSYTVMNEDHNLNFTRFEMTNDLEEFIQRSLAARDESSKAIELLHTASNRSSREIKDYVFITSLPWFDFTSIQHPVAQFKNADIPSIAWGRFNPLQNGKLGMSFSVQAHHGFVDGFHINQLVENLKKEISRLLS